MRGARSITVFGTVLFAGISLASLRAEVISDSASSRRATGFGEALNEPERFFPGDRPFGRSREDDWSVEFATYDAGAAVEEPHPEGPYSPEPTPVSRQDGMADKLYPPDRYEPFAPGREGPYAPGPNGSYPPSPGGPVNGPECGTPWMGGPSLGGPVYYDAYGGAYGPGCGVVTGPYCPPDGGPICEGGTCEPAGPIVIEEGWGDVFNGWMHGTPAGLVAGVEGTFLVPIDEPTQRVILKDLVTGRRWSEDPHGCIGGGVRTWIGLQHCGRGFRVRYWHFRNANVDLEPGVPVFAEPVIHESYHLKANTLDFELTQRFFVHCWEIDTSFGARYADLERFSQLLGTGQIGNGVDVYGLAWGANEIEGAGFTASIGGRRPIACSPWNFFWNFRGSVLWADATVSAFTDAAAFTHDPAGVAHSRNHANAASEKSESVFIADAQLGVEYRICLCRCPGQLAFRAGMEFQHWDTGDLRAQSESFAFLKGEPPPFGGEAFAAADAHDGDLDLIGFLLGVEWTY